MKEKLINIPNSVTFIRFLLVFPLLYFILNEKIIPALIIFIIAALSDKLDGFLASKFNQKTRFGKFFDAFVDTLLLAVILLSLLFINIVSFHFALLIILPRIITLIIYLIKKKEFTTSIYSRVAASLLYLTIVSIMLNLILLSYLLLIFVYLLSIIHWNKLRTLQNKYFL